jgi:hypothetical protein
LYIDRLAALINIDSLYIPVSRRVSLDIGPSAMKEGAEVADLLRRAGWIIMFALEGKKAQDCGWDVEVRSSSPRLSVLNCGSGERSVCENVIEVLAVVGCV